jgi:antitoxin component YwqK of YwqJK toxin-antitoxin module
MKNNLIKLCSLILLLFSVMMASAQENQTDDQGRKHGYWKKTDSQGQWVYEGTFEHGTPVGEFTHYYPYRKVKSKVVYSDSARVLRVKKFYKNGKLQAEGKYVEKKMDSTWNYYSKKGVLVRTEHYNEGVKDSTWKSYYIFSGNINEVTQYEDGKRHGVWKQYFDNGNLKLKTYYRRGKRHGNFKVFYPSGELRKEGDYKNGLRHGIWISKFENGGLKQKIRYEHGDAEILIDNTEEEENDSGGNQTNRPGE